MNSIISFLQEEREIPIQLLHLHEHKIHQQVTTVDILSINAGSRLQTEAANIARTNGYQFARGFSDAHAEVIGANAALARGLVNPVTVSSRPMCPGCVANSLQNNVLMGTESQRPFTLLPK